MNQLDKIFIKIGETTQKLFWGTMELIGKSAWYLVEKIRI